MKPIDEHHDTIVPDEMQGQFQAAREPVKLGIDGELKQKRKIQFSHLDLRLLLLEASGSTNKEVQAIYWLFLQTCQEYYDLSQTLRGRVLHQIAHLPGKLSPIEFLSWDWETKKQWLGSLAVCGTFLFGGIALSEQIRTQTDQNVILWAALPWITWLATLPFHEFKHFSSKKAETILGEVNWEKDGLEQVHFARRLKEQEASDLLKLLIREMSEFGEPRNPKGFSKKIGKEENQRRRALHKEEQRQVQAAAKERDLQQRKNEEKRKAARIAQEEQDRLDALLEQVRSNVPPRDDSFTENRR